MRWVVRNRVALPGMEPFQRFFAATGVCSWVAFILSRRLHEPEAASMED